MAGQAPESHLNVAAEEPPGAWRTRASDPELEALRRRVAAGGAEIGRLQARIAELEGASSVTVQAGHGERERLLAELSSERAGRRALAQALQDERDRRRELEAALELVRSPEGDAGSRELAALRRRVAALEGELETVRRHDAEFEQAIRLAVDDAWSWLAQARNRIESALAEVEALRRAAALAAPGEGQPVRLEALDQALSRLRERPAGGPAAGDATATAGSAPAVPPRRHRWRRR